ncbi:hypothetical protein KJR58_24305 [Escherichia coli]|nr:hypothetical protein [Escherichia coli]
MAGSDGDKRKAQGTLFCGESMFSRMENASKRRFWYSVRNLSVMAVSLSTARSLTITQHRFCSLYTSPSPPH